MIKIYTSQLKKINTINDNDNYFFQNISPQGIDELAKKVMKFIDGAELIDSSTGKIQTSRGIGSIENLSTGCKTVLNYIYAREYDKEIEAINISYCGYNALDVLFDIAEKDDNEIVFILLHKDGIYKCKDREYLIDGKRQINTLLDM